ncbi:hypothetical protein HK101_002013 [Irineochytrium annulatum]|nr:hypothetical protein HK101_002013 [Irineochytrium annulatum]
MDFSRIYEESKRLTSHIVNPGTIPQLERGLDQIDAQTRKLSTKSSRAADTSFGASQGAGQQSIFQQQQTPSNGASGQIDTRTAYLLANRGYDAEKVTATLNLINPAATFEPMEGLFDTDIEGYIRQQHEKIVSSAVEESQLQTKRDCDERFERGMHRDWEKAKKRIFQELGQHQQKTAGRGKKSPARGNDAGIQMTARNKQYAEVVQKLNKMRQDKVAYELLHAFQAVAVRLDRGDIGHQQLIKCWRLLYTTFDEQPSSSEATVDPTAMDLGGLKRRQIRQAEYFEAYRSLEEGAGMSEDAVKFRQRVVEGGKQFLQANFKEFLQLVVQQNKFQFSSGIPTENVYVDAFIELKFKRYNQWQPQYNLEIIGGKARWAHLFFLLRSGAKCTLNYAIEFANLLDGTEDARFCVYFQEFCNEGRLSTKLRNELMEHWNGRIKNILQPDPSGKTHGDPFKAALYKIIGRCEMSSKVIKNQEVLPSVEDYLWLQLMLIREDIRADEALQDRYTLRDMTRNMLRFGAAHFSPQNRSPHVYFLVLMLCGEYERAVAHLITHEMFAADAIHFGIGMAYYGILRVPDSPHLSDTYELLTVRTAESAPSGSPLHEIAYFQFERMINQYARQYFASNSVEAFHYITLVAMLGCPLGDEMERDDYNGARAGPISETTLRKEYTRATYSHIIDLLLDSRIAPKLIGNSLPGGMEYYGEIELHGPLIYINDHVEFIARLIRPAAEEADRRGKFEEAIHLYNKSGDYDMVIGILCKQLGEILASHRVSSADLSDPFALGMGLGVAASETETISAKAKDLYQHYRSRPEVMAKISDARKKTCLLLIQLQQFMHESDSGRLDIALNTLKLSGIVPLQPDMMVVTRMSEDFKAYDESVARSLPQVLVTALRTIAGLFKSLKDAKYADAGRLARMQELRDMGRAIILFAGSIQYRIPADVLRLLNRLNVMMS